MKKFVITVLVLLFVIGAEIRSQWAVRNAVAFEKANNLMEVVKLKRKHSKEIFDLKQKHRKEISKVKAKERAKAKFQRAVSAVPGIGLIAFSVFEKIEFEKWQKENPQGSLEQYTTEIGTEMTEVIQTEYEQYKDEYQQFESMLKNMDSALSAD